MRSKSSRDACSAWGKAKRISGFMRSYQYCWRRSAPSVMPPPAPSRPSPSGSVSRRPMRPLSSTRWRRTLPRWPLSQPPHRPPPCYVNLQEKKKTLPLSSAMYRLLLFALPPVPRMRMPHQRSQAARLNDLLFEVGTIVTPHVANSFVPKSRSALHTFARAGRGADTRGETKLQLTRCPYLSEHASIAAECVCHPFSRMSGSLVLPLGW